MKPPKSIAAGLAGLVLLGAGHFAAVHADAKKKPPAVAAPPVDPTEAKYRALIDDALRDFETKNYEESLALFEQAFAIKPSARVQRGIGKVLFELRQYRKSIETFDAALANQTDALTGSLKDEVVDLRARALRYTGVLKVQVVPATAETLIDGKPADPKAFAEGMRVDIGSHMVEASAPGYQPKRRTADLTGGDEQTVAIKLDPIPVASGKRTWLYGAIGLDIFFGVSTIGSVAWFIDRSSAVNTCQAAFDSGATCGNADKLASQRNLSIASLTVSLIGLAGSGAFTYYVLKIQSKERNPSAPMVGCAPLQGGLYCGGMAKW